MSAIIVDYRNPLHAALRRRVHAMLRGRDTLFRARVIAMLLLGMLLSLGALVLVTFGLIALAREWNTAIDWRAAFALCTVLLLPMLYLLEHRTRGEFFIDTARHWSLGETSRISACSAPPAVENGRCKRPWQHGRPASRFSFSDHDSQ